MKVILNIPETKVRRIAAILELELTEDFENFITNTVEIDKSLLSELDDGVMSVIASTVVYAYTKTKEE